MKELKMQYLFSFVFTVDYSKVYRLLDFTAFLHTELECGVIRRKTATMVVEIIFEQ